jgi:hypothetical protein
MPPTLMNGKICYVEIPATDIARLIPTDRSSAGRSDNAVTDAPPLTTRPAK